MSPKSAKRVYLFFLPDLVTCFNLFTGFLAMLMTARGELIVAGWLILLALVWDSLDGNIARIFKNPTLLGRELDSLSDMVSFVAAPVFMASHLLMEHLDAGILSVVFLYLAAGAFRLARFNLKTPTKGYFVGLPTPAAALTLVMAILASMKNQWVSKHPFAPVLMLVIMALAFLMVSEIHYPKFSAMPFVRWQSFLYMGLVALGVITMRVNVETGIAAVFFLFLIISPVYALSSYAPAKANYGKT
ncbi:MAG: CDP-diacylglycerol--serine O-phosphatidyltransferase [Candidatus Omnitrophica bacterium]|nr:CDP-diacylglycerol--serine O-phosphatidyltransferase [Candidatus Omnitrophota bacterium]